MRQPNFHHAGNARGLFCSTHKEPGMVNVVSKPCQHPGCTKQPSFNMPGCTQARPPAPPPAAVALQPRCGGAAPGVGPAARCCYGVHGLSH